MSKPTRTVYASIVFIAGCAVGGTASSFVVPPASAQQQAASGFQKWDYFCFQEYDPAKLQTGAKKAGAEGWEMASSAAAPYAIPVWCFKRPLPH